MTQLTSRPRPTSAQEARQRQRARMRRLRIIWFGIGCISGLLISFLLLGASSFLSDKKTTLQSEPKPITQEETIAAPEPEIEEAEPEPEPITWPQRIDFTVAAGDTLAGILNEHGIGANDAYNIIESMDNIFNPRNLREGHKLHLVLAKDKSRPNEAEAATLQQLSIFINKLDTVHIYAHTEDKSSFRVEKETKKLASKLDYAQGSIKDGSSLAGSATAQGVPNSIINKLIKAYSYDIDFQRSIKAGDSFEIFYEKLVTPDGVTVKGGDVNYAMLKTGGKTHKIYYYQDKYTPGKFYNEKGESIVKTLLRTPVDGARISSGFGKRRHPILGYNKMHTGLDFAAPRGTKIYAAGDGTVTYAGRKGGYGNFVSIRHNSTYTTNYAHAKGFARGIKKGKRVRQGQVIAYVGTTGRSTGPHLHYEIVKNGKKINPNSVKFLNSGKLSRKQMNLFDNMKSRFTRQIADIEKQKKADALKVEAEKAEAKAKTKIKTETPPATPKPEAPKKAEVKPEPKPAEKPVKIERTPDGLPIIKIEKN